MTPARVASALIEAQTLATDARATWETTEDLPEKDAAITVYRSATALARSLERWMTTRALRAQLTKAG